VRRSGWNCLDNRLPRQAVPTDDDLVITDGAQVYRDLKRAATPSVYTTPNRSARSLRSVAASLLNRSISALPPPAVRMLRPKGNGLRSSRKYWTSYSYTASLNSLATRKATFLLALILIASPCRVPSHPSGTLPNLEDAEAGQADFIAPLQMAGCQRYQVAKHGLGLPLRQVMAVRQGGGQMLECDGGLCRILRRSGGLLRRFWWLSSLGLGLARPRSGVAHHPDATATLNAPVANGGHSRGPLAQLNSSAEKTLVGSAELKGRGYWPLAEHLHTYSMPSGPASSLRCLSCSPSFLLRWSCFPRHPSLPR
jgi:hypothetical protein